MIIQNGRYIDLLKDFQPMLSAWLKDFERFTLPPYIRHILAIEYEYVRIYLNSLSLQAVVERCTNSAEISGPLQGHQASSLNLAALSPETQSYYGKLPLAKLGGYGEADSAYVKEVVDGSRSLLRTVVEGLLPNGYLKHAPVRTYFRIISGAMFLLKTFALGAPKNEIEISIGLMDRAVDALRNCVVDDVHLGIRYAELLETLTTRLRSRFIHSAFQLQHPSASSGAQSPAALNSNQSQQQLNGTENRENWSANLGAPTFDQLTNQSGMFYVLINLCNISQSFVKLVQVTTAKYRQILTLQSQQLLSLQYRTSPSTVTRPHRSQLLTQCRVSTPITATLVETWATDSESTEAKGTTSGIYLLELPSFKTMINQSRRLLRVLTSEVGIYWI